MMMEWIDRSSSKKEKILVKKCSTCSQRYKWDSKKQPFKLEYLALKAVLENVHNKKEDVETCEAIFNSCSHSFDRFTICRNGIKEKCNKVFRDIVDCVHENKKKLNLVLHCRCKWPMCYTCEWFTATRIQLPFAHYANCQF